MWEDSIIDSEAKKFIKKEENGKKLPLDIVSHLDFFYNTLLLSHETRNPFNNPKRYPALNFILMPPSVKSVLNGEKGSSILEMHYKLTYPLHFDLCKVIGTSNTKD